MRDEVKLGYGTFTWICLVLSVTCTEVRGDIYRYRNADGVLCFTDSPTGRSAVRVMKEPQAPRHARRGRRPVLHRQVKAAVQKDGDCLDGYREGSKTGRVLPVPGPVSSPVGMRHDPIDGVLRDHKGVDIATPTGTPVRPVAAGIVTFSGYRTGYGNTVVIRHNDGTTTLYAHNSVNLKAKGDPVDRDSTIAFSGATGRTTGPHLHFEAWRGDANITASFVPGAAAHSASARRDDDIRRIVQADGTLMFTNLP